jgi:membrane fusion protein (multidrug efflux system)
VFVVTDGKIEKRAVTIGRRIPGFVVITEGLSEGESVVTEGTGKVRDGSDVELLGQT